ncbi:MAG: hypothetical protein ACRDFC_00685 [Ignavibacteria bacterium]
MKNLFIISLLILLYSEKSIAQSHRDNSSNWSLSVNGGVSLLLPALGGDGLFSYVGRSVSLERFELKFGLVIKKRHLILLILGRDKFNLYRYTASINDPSGKIYKFIGQEYNNWLGLSYNFIFYKTKSIEYFGGTGIASNDSKQLINLQIGLSKPIIKDISIKLNLRYTMLYSSIFEKREGSQLGFDYGISYSF